MGNWIQDCHISIFSLLFYSAVTNWFHKQ
jgi:hypothetical protein